MAKALLTETSVEAILGSLGAEAATGQVELIVAEAAVLALVLAGKKIAQTVQQRKQEKRLERQNQEQIEEFRREEEQLNDQRTNQRNNQADIVGSQFSQVTAGLDRERNQRIRQLESQMGLNIEDDRIHSSTPDPDFWMQSEEVKREIAQRQEEEKKEGLEPYDPNVNYFERRFGNGGNGGGGNGGGGNGGGGNGGNGNPYPNGGGSSSSNNRNKNPFDQMSNWIQSLINQQDEREKQEQEKQDKINEKKQQTDQEKYQTELQKENRDNSKIIQEQLQAQLYALSQSEKTAEEVYVELEQISKTIDRQIPNQVQLSPADIFSSDIVRF